jgi:hypothetical protein
MPQETPARVALSDGRFVPRQDRLLRKNQRAFRRRQQPRYARYLRHDSRVAEVELGVSHLCLCELLIGHYQNEDINDT